MERSYASLIRLLTGINPVRIHINRFGKIIYWSLEVFQTNPARDKPNVPFTIPENL